MLSTIRAKFSKTTLPLSSYKPKSMIRLRKNNINLISKYFYNINSLSPVPLGLIDVKSLDGRNFCGPTFTDKFNYQLVKKQTIQLHSEIQ